MKFSRRFATRQSTQGGGCDSHPEQHKDPDLAIGNVVVVKEISPRLTVDVVVKPNSNMIVSTTPEAPIP